MANIVYKESATIDDFNKDDFLTKSRNKKTTNGKTENNIEILVIYA